jgi:hypothetical protein
MNFRKKIKTVVVRKLFQPSLIFTGMVRAYPSETHFWRFPLQYALVQTLDYSGKACQDQAL